VVISAPSGSGKSTIVARVVKENRSSVLSISCTTRAPRGEEKNGRDYYFLDEDEFQRRVKDGEFLEWAEVHGHYYGTLKKTVESQLENGKDVLLTIDVQGAHSIRRHFPWGIFIFLVPPSWDVLVKRLKDRGSDDAKSIQTRLANAKKEMATLNQFDFLVVNDKLDAAVADVGAIIKASHCRLSNIHKETIPIFSGEGHV
jgi:guanylate kinase